MTKLIGPELSVPENWDNVEQFGEWFRANGCPFRLPADAKIFETDVSMSMIMFRQGDYQAELYMMKPNITVPKHSHPMRQIILWLGGWIKAFRKDHPNTANANYQTEHSGYMSSVLEKDTWHAFETTDKGAMLIVLEQWNTKSEKSSATMAYDGEPLGPIHAETLRQVRMHQQ